PAVGRPADVGQPADVGDGSDAEGLAGALLGWSLIVLGPVCLAGVLAAPALARLLTTGTADPVVAAGQRHLATFLLRLFVPQVLLYAVGAVTTAVLHAKRRFTVTAVAPIGNTVMMVAALLAFRALHGPGVAGGVVAYQVAFACFLVPYAVLALPLVTAVLPELAGEVGRGDLPAFGRSLRWALDGMVGFVIPVSVAGVVFAPRVMEALAFGQTS